jgi:hypothetical protein
MRCKVQASSNPLPDNFPCELAAEACVHSGEAMWRPSVAMEAIEWFGAHGYAVLGTEVLRPEQHGIQSIPYFQSVERKPDEDWNVFVGRATAEAISYLTAFIQRFAEEGDVYINPTWVNESEFQRLSAT